MPTKVETLILRFRDLVTMQGGTIESHRAEIAARGHVWWGWWNKGGEKVPVQAFIDVNERCQAGGLTIFLFDSGREIVYEATCSKVQWQADLSRFRSPAPDNTPAYYQEEAYLAWFKLDDISLQPVEPDVLRHWTYLQIDDFFESGNSRYRPFYGKKVSSPQELRQQDRSIWFLRAFQQGDRSNEILLLDAHSFTPADFPDQFKVSAARHLLWLSDLHFSVDGHHGYPPESDMAQRALWHSIERALNDQRASELAGVLISGDVTWKADDAEFHQARGFIRELSSKLNLGNYDYLICPGNHDLTFSTEPWNKGQKVTATVDAATAAYKEFYESLFFISPNKHLACARRIVLGRSVSVEIVALNTHVLQQAKNLFQGHGFVGQEQLDFVAEQMRWKEPPDGDRPLRILMLHHHLLPVTFRAIPEAGANYSVALDAEAIVRWIVDHRVKIVLHGHMHQPFYAQVTRRARPARESPEHSFWVLGLGSSGVKKADLGEIGKNTIGLLTFSTDSMEYRLMTIDPVHEAEELWKVRIPI